MDKFPWHEVSISKENKAHSNKGRLVLTVVESRSSSRCSKISVKWSIEYSSGFRPVSGVAGTPLPPSYSHFKGQQCICNFFDDANVCELFLDEQDQRRIRTPDAARIALGMVTTQATASSMQWYPSAIM